LVKRTLWPPIGPAAMIVGNVITVVPALFVLPLT
jgi:hypothetical protein